MKRAMSLAGLLVAAAASAWASTSLTVNVNDQTGAGIPFATVYVIHFQQNGFDATSSTIATANASGVATFPGLTNGNWYDVFASSQNYFPPLSQQYNDPNHPGFSANGGTASPITIVLSSGAQVNVGEVDIRVKNATSTLIAGDLKYSNGGYLVASGFGTFDPVANLGTIKVFNVLPAPGQTYNLDAFDPAGTNGNNATIGNYGSAVTAGQTIVTAIIDMAASAAPPPAAVSQIQQGGSNGNENFDGVVTDTNGVNTVPFVGISFAYKKVDNYGCQAQFGGCTQTTFVNADNNGHFQLFGLQPETTYYASAQGGCFFNQNTNTSQCYVGFNSPAITSQQPNLVIDTTAAPGANDIIIHSTTTLTVGKINLKTATGGTGKMVVYIQGNGALLPWSGVSLWPDYSPWITCGNTHTTNNNCGALPADCPSQGVSNPGFSSFNGQATTGYILINNLLSGNYTLSAYTGFSQGGNGTMFNSTSTSSNNGGPNNTFSQCGNSNFRLAIDTGTSPTVKIFDSFGNLLNGSPASSVTITVPLNTAAYSGALTGTINFTGASGASVDLSATPITITLQPQCNGGNGPCTGGNVKIFNSASQALSSNYQIQVASGQSYFFNVNSSYWGLVQGQGGGSNNVNLSSTGTAVMNLTFAPAGRWIGKVYRPDGAVYTPPTNSWSNVNANGKNSWGWSQINPDGTFVIGGLLPGVYHGGFQANSSNIPLYTLSLPAPTISVTANQDMAKDISLVNGVNVQVTVDTTTLPPIGFANCPQQNNGDQCPPETWNVQAFAAGTQLGPDQMRELMRITGGGGQENFSFEFRPNGNCMGGRNALGFCMRVQPDQLALDMHLVRQGRFDQNGFDNPPVRPFFVLYTSSKNVVIDSSKATSLTFQSLGGPFGSTVAFQNVGISLPSSLHNAPQGTLRGSITAQNMINAREFTALGGDFNNFLKYIILAALYDSSGTLKAGAASVPLPTCMSQLAPGVSPPTMINDRLNQFVAAGDFTGFQNLVNNSCMAPPWLFEIRGLTPGQTYNLVLQSPNYPPYKTTVALSSVNGDTTTVSINLDQVVGTGATITGTVSNTSGSAIAGAAVTIKGPYGPTTVTTDSNGTYSLGGLDKGIYRIKVVAPGYALRSARVSAASFITYTQNFTLPSGPGSITGVVRDIKPPRQPLSAKVFAYNDTLNAQNPGTELALYETDTSSMGVYTIAGLESSNTYKIFFKSTGKRVVMVSTVATSGVVTLPDQAMADLPLDIEAYGYPAGTNYEFKVLNPKQFSSGRAWIGASPFVKSGATEVTSLFVQKTQPNGSMQLTLDYPISSLGSSSHVLHIEAISKDPTPANLAGQPDVVKDITFNATTPGSTVKHMDEALIGDDETDQRGIPDNAATVDNSGQDKSQLSLPAGALIPASTGAIPTANLTASKTDDPSVSTTVAAATGGSSAFASSLYTMTLSSANYTGTTGVGMTLQFNQNGTSFNDLAIYHLNSTTGKWELVPGLQTLDALKGTITVDSVKSLTTVSGLKRGHPMMALADGRGFRPNGLLADDSGVFAILRPSVVGGSFTGTEVKIFNFPNPFNLQTKTLTLANGGSTPSITTNGTVIKYELPSGTNGHVYIRIYTLVGELVREIDQGNQTGGSYYYTTWDGTNRRGANVANGVYYGILSVDGSKTQNGIFKLAVIK